MTKSSIPAAPEPNTGAGASETLFAEMGAETKGLADNGQIMTNFLKTLNEIVEIRASRKLRPYYLSSVQIDRLNKRLSR